MGAVKRTVMVIIVDVLYKNVFEKMYLSYFIPICSNEIMQTII